MPNRPAFDDPQWREKMAEYHRNQSWRDLPGELGHIGETAVYQHTAPQVLKSPVMPLPAWMRLMTELFQQSAQGSMRNKLGDDDGTAR